MDNSTTILIKFTLILIMGMLVYGLADIPAKSNKAKKGIEQHILDRMYIGR